MVSLVTMCIYVTLSVTQYCVIMHYSTVVLFISLLSFSLSLVLPYHTLHVPMCVIIIVLVHVIRTKLIKS